MSAAALTLLALLTVAGIAERALPLRSPAGPVVLTAVMTALLAAAAWCAAVAPEVQGAVRAAGLVLTVAAAAVSADAVVRTVFTVGIVRRRGRSAGSGPPGARAREAESVDCAAENAGEDAAGEDAGVDAEEADAPVGPLRGGYTIGILERAAVAVAVLAGWPEGIAVVMAVKGLARYPELRAPDASEQFIIGTFASVLWSLAVTGTGLLLIG